VAFFLSKPSKGTPPLGFFLPRKSSRFEFGDAGVVTLNHFGNSVQAVFDSFKPVFYFIETSFHSLKARLDIFKTFINPVEPLFNMLEADRNCCS